MTREKALEHKALGNTEFAGQNFAAAAKHFSAAIAEDPTDHVFYSNRSACYSSLCRYEEALEDGSKCVELKPDWAKGYTRKGLAEYFLKQYEAAEKTYECGLKLAPGDKGLKEGLEKVVSAKASGFSFSAGGGGNPLANLDMSRLMQAMQRNPKIGEYLQDKALMAKFQMLLEGQKDPKMMQALGPSLMQDQRLLELVMAYNGMDMPEGQEPFAPEHPKPEPPTKVQKRSEEPKDERSEEQKTADAFKEEGNKLYKARKFDEAIAQYDQAIAACPNDLIYYNNKCAVLLEQEKFEEVETLAKDLLARKYEMNSAMPGGASFEKVGKVMNRLASCYAKQQKYDQAIEIYERSVAEDNTRNTRNALRDIRKEKDKFEKDAYVDVAKAEGHRERGNEHFKNGNWIEAKKEYDEGVRRNPKDPKIFSNRAAALQKLLAHPDALRDLDEALKLDPKFVKAYSRKGACYFFMKDYNKAVKTYELGLKIDPNDAGCLKGKQETLMKIQSTAMSGGGPVDEQQVQEAMKDPEIQSILKDPQMNMILKQMQENPKEAMNIINSDAKVANAVQKLMAAGILKMG